jgi:hypothetical protein
MASLQRQPRAVPYIYVYDGSTLTDGTSPRGLEVQNRNPLSFAFRRIEGLQSLATSMQLYYPGRSNTPMFSRAARLGANVLCDHDVIAQPGQTIQFDLNTVARQNDGCGTPIYTSQLAFQGWRYSPDAAPKPRGLKPLPYTLRYTLTLDWYRYFSLPAAVVQPARLQAIDIANYDFELHRMRIRRSDGTITSSDFALQLLDANGYETSNLPVIARTVNELVSPAAFFPAIGLLYPVKSQLRFWVTSLLCNTAFVLPQTYEICFEGVQWV